VPNVAKASSIVLVVVSDVAAAPAIVVLVAARHAEVVAIVLRIARAISVMTPHLAEIRAVVTRFVPDVAKAGSTFERTMSALPTRGSVLGKEARLVTNFGPPSSRSLSPWSLSFSSLPIVERESHSPLGALAIDSPGTFKRRQVAVLDIVVSTASGRVVFR
jgi:hypothetical protein